MKKLLYITIFLLVTTLSCDDTQQHEDLAPEENLLEEVSKDSIPEETEVKQYDITNLYPTANGEIIHHTYYSLSYMEEHEQAEWVFYMLTPNMVNGTTERTDNFREDAQISTGSSKLIDYKGSGYDRGHLAPAKAMSLNDVSMSESFFMSNMSPQSPSCNRGRWKSLETQVREWVDIHDTLYVATGAILKDSLGSIGISNVTIPSFYYKVILCPQPDTKMIAFIMPNEKMEESIDYYVTSVDNVEAATGIDFFPAFPDVLEEKLESSSDFSAW